MARESTPDLEIEAGVNDPWNATFPMIAPACAAAYPEIDTGDLSIGRLVSASWSGSNTHAAR